MQSYKRAYEIECANFPLIDSKKESLDSLKKNIEILIGGEISPDTGPANTWDSHYIQTNGLYSNVLQFYVATKVNRRMDDEYDLPIVIFVNLNQITEAKLDDNLGKFNKYINWGKSILRNRSIEPNAVFTFYNIFVCAIGDNQKITTEIAKVANANEVYFFSSEQVKTGQTFNALQSLIYDMKYNDSHHLGLNQKAVPPVALCLIGPNFASAHPSATKKYCENATVRSCLSFFSDSVDSPEKIIAERSKNLKHFNGYQDFTIAMQGGGGYEFDSLKFFDVIFLFPNLSKKAFGSPELFKYFCDQACKKITQSPDIFILKIFASMLTLLCCNRDATIPLPMEVIKIICSNITQLNDLDVSNYLSENPNCYRLAF